MIIFHWNSPQKGVPYGDVRDFGIPISISILYVATTLLVYHLEFHKFWTLVLAVCISFFYSFSDLDRSGGTFP